MFFLNRSLCSYFGKIARWKLMFLFPREILGWCSSIQCSLAYDFTIEKQGILLKRTHSQGLLRSSERACIMGPSSLSVTKHTHSQRKQQWRLWHHTLVSAGHLKWPGMRTAIGLAQYFALLSVLLFGLWVLTPCWSTPSLLVSCEIVSCGMKGCWHNMAQRTVTTRLSPAQTARKNLEAEIAELRAEIASCSPPADSKVPPLDISQPSLPHQVHDRSGAPDMDTPAPGIAQLLHQQQQMINGYMWAYVCMPPRTRSVDAHHLFVLLTLQKSSVADSRSTKHGNAAQLAGSRMGSLSTSIAKPSKGSLSWSYCRLPGGKRSFLLRRTASWAFEQIVHTTSHNLLVRSTTRRGRENGQWSGRPTEGARSCSRRKKTSVRRP